MLAPLNLIPVASTKTQNLKLVYYILCILFASAITTCFPAAIYVWSDKMQ